MSHPLVGWRTSDQDGWGLRSNLICRGIFEDFHAGSKGNLYSKIATPRRYGLAGTLACVAAFLLPSIKIVIFLSFLYSRYHAIPALQGVLVGLGPVVIALILAAAWSMARKALTNWPAVMFAVAGAVAGAFAFKVNAIWMLVAVGVIGLVVGLKRLMHGTEQNRSNTHSEESTPPETGNMAFMVLPAAGASVVPVSFATLGLTFLKIGLVFFGGGFVFIPVLHQQLVDHLHWLTPQEFLDGVAGTAPHGRIAGLARSFQMASRLCSGWRCRFSGAGSDSINLVRARRIVSGFDSYRPVISNSI